MSDSDGSHLRRRDDPQPGGTIVVGDAHAEPLLDVTALESGGFEVDPRTQQLKRLPAILLKGMRRAARAE